MASQVAVNPLRNFKRHLAGILATDRRVQLFVSATTETTSPSRNRNVSMKWTPVS